MARTCQQPTLTGDGSLLADRNPVYRQEPVPFRDDNNDDDNDDDDDENNNNNNNNKKAECLCLATVMATQDRLAGGPLTSSLAHLEKINK